MRGSLCITIAYFEGRLPVPVMVVEISRVQVVVAPYPIHGLLVATAVKATQIFYFVRSPVTNKLLQLMITIKYFFHNH